MTKSLMSLIIKNKKKKKKCISLQYPILLRLKIQMTTKKFCSCILDIFYSLFKYKNFN